MATPRALTLAALVAVVALLGASCTDSDSDSGGEGDGSSAGAVDIEVGADGYGAVITRTSDGVPHVRAADVPSAMFGQGWASAQDHPCDLVDQVIKVHSRRAATFGPGEGGANILSDFAWRVLGVADRASIDWVDANDTVRSVIEGFTAGWNAQVEDVGVEGVDDWCAGSEWMRTITPEELYAYARSIPLLASGARLTQFLATAQPPGSSPVVPADLAGETSLGSTAPADEDATLASNGWAIGSERSAGGGGMVLGNPHFPWIGELRFWEVQLTTDDGMDVYGAQLLGLPGVGIGFTEGMAWTHTVSAGKRFTAYLMELDPADPTRYVIDGESMAMVPEEFTIEVKGDDGTLTSLTRTYWYTEFGPVLDFPGVGWTPSTTVSYRDANFDNTQFVEMYLEMDRADSLDELIEVQERFQAVPLFNTIAADADGTVWYADTAATPNLSPEAIAAYEERLETDPLTELAADSGAVLLEGNTSRDRWVDDPDAPWPGVLPWSELPQIERDDYVMNANDSYWVANSEALITGDFSPLQGLQDTSRSVRTRENLRVLDDTSSDGPSGDDAKFDLEELQAAALLNEAYTEQQWRADVVDRCRAAAAAGPVQSDELRDESGAVAVASESVEIGTACEVLAGWDGRYDVDSRGAVLWRELVDRLDFDDMWATPFDPAEPATTPSGLGPAVKDGKDLVTTGIATAVAVIDKVGYALDIPLGEAQFDARLPDQRLPVPGGLGLEGITNVVADSRQSATTKEPRPDLPGPVADGSTLTSAGYPITYGTSFLMAVEFTRDGPSARTILTYGESGNPSNPAFSTQMEDFAAKRWKTVLFTAEDIAADEDATVTEVKG